MTMSAAELLADLQARGGALTAEITVSSYSSYLAFLEGYTRSLLAMQSGFGKARSWLKDAIGAAKPELRLEADSTGTLGMSVKFPTVRTDKDISRLAAEVFARPGPLREARKTRIVVAREHTTVLVGDLGPFADLFGTDHDKGQFAKFGCAELGLVVLEIGGQRLEGGFPDHSEALRVLRLVSKRTAAT